MCIDWLCNILGCCKEDSEVPLPEIVGNIEYSELLTLLKAEFGMDVAILLSDYHYKLTTKKSFERFLADDNTNNYIYSGDPGLNCDNYASILCGRTAIPGWGEVPIGSCWLSTPAHALNIFVDENNNVYYTEPQNDQMWLVKDKPEWIPYIVWL